MKTLKNLGSLSVAIDLGGSQSRAFFTLDSFKPELILLEPEVTVASKQSLERYERDRLGSASPEDIAWIEHKGVCWVVGRLAQKKGADLQLKKLKLELAIPKILAIVGAISEKHELPNGTPINLGIFVPCGEYQKRYSFKQQITEALANFNFRGKEKTFQLENFICLPEGGGVLTRGRAPGASLKNEIICVVMAGFRDVSILPVERGDFGGGYTESRGMANMISAVKNRTAIQDTHKLIAAISKAGKNVNPRALIPLVEHVADAYKQEELSNIRQTILEAREEYWLSLSQWLRLYVPREADEIILSGGTAQYFRQELNMLFSHSKTNWCEDLERQINNAFGAQITARSLQYRLTDVYGLFFYLCGSTKFSRVNTNND
jgi:hypothetical protein